MKTILAANLGIEDWLKAAFSGLPSAVSAICIFLICLILSISLSFLCGKLWNKGFTLSGWSGALVGVLSLLAAFSLAMADILDGGNFFQGDLPQKLSVVSKPDENGNPGVIHKGHIGYELVSSVASRKDRNEDNSIVITAVSVNNLKATETALIVLAGSCLIGLCLGVAVCSYKDIKHIKPVA